MKYDRINEIEKLIKKNKTITNEELCVAFSISMPTLRRDLLILENRGSIKKVYGGVIAKDNVSENGSIDYTSRVDEALSSKQYIGKKASEFVSDGDVIFVDSGSTAYCMIPYLEDKKDVTVVTHSLNVIETLRAYPNINVVVLGGVFVRKTNSFNVNVEEIPYSFDKAFLATVGISKEGCTNVQIFESRIKQYVIKHSNLNVLLCDKRKIGIDGFNRFAKLEDFQVIISDDNFPKWLINLAKKNQIELVN